MLPNLQLVGTLQLFAISYTFKFYYVFNIFLQLWSLSLTLSNIICELAFWCANYQFFPGSHCSWLGLQLTQAGWLEEQKWIFSQVWRLQIQGQGATRVAFWRGLFSWLADGPLLTMPTWSIEVFLFAFSIWLSIVLIPIIEKNILSPDLPVGSFVKNLPGNAEDEGDMSFIPGLGRLTEVGNGNSL